VAVRGVDLELSGAVVDLTGDSFLRFLQGIRIGQIDQAEMGSDPISGVVCVGAGPGLNC